jgi:hypothetical protein
MALDLEWQQKMAEMLLKEEEQKAERNYLHRKLYYT